MDDYRGSFDPSVDLESFSRGALAAIGREYMLFGHLLNGAGLPWVHIKLGAPAREAIAIELWMGASPVYTQRMQRALGFAGGDDVETIFKGLQLDVGFAHQYMDVRYRLESRDHGTFWLPSCGALLEVEPYGERQVRSMCHAIEDPTFDATAVATNPRARIRPVHRPPRLPVDRVPHCEWTVRIDHDAEPVSEIPLTGRVRASRLASFAFPPPTVADDGGHVDYSGRTVEEPHLEMFSRRALVTICRELLVQDHLLVRAQMMALAERRDDALAREIAMQQWIGAGAVGSLRMRAVLGLDGHDDVETILKVLQVHPAFVPGYTRFAFERLGAGRGLIRLDDCAALREDDGFSWFTLLDAEPHPALGAMVQAVNPRARCVAVPPPAGARHAWEVTIDPAAEPAAEPPEVDYLRKTGTARFAFRVRQPAA